MLNIFKKKQTTPEPSALPHAPERVEADKDMNLITALFEANLSHYKCGHITYHQYIETLEEINEIAVRNAIRRIERLEKELGIAEERKADDAVVA